MDRVSIQKLTHLSKNMQGDCVDIEAALPILVQNKSPPKLNYSKSKVSRNQRSPIGDISQININIDNQFQSPGRDFKSPKNEIEVQIKNRTTKHSKKKFLFMPSVDGVKKKPVPENDNNEQEGHAPSLKKAKQKHIRLG